MCLLETLLKYGRKTFLYVVVFVRQYYLLCELNWKERGKFMEKKRRNIFGVNTDSVFVSLSLFFFVSSVYWNLAKSNNLVSFLIISFILTLFNGSLWRRYVLHCHQHKHTFNAQYISVFIHYIYAPHRSTLFPTHICFPEFKKKLNMLISGNKSEIVFIFFFYLRSHLYDLRWILINSESDISRMLRNECKKKTFKWFIFGSYVHTKTNFCIMHAIIYVV